MGVGGSKRERVRLLRARKVSHSLTGSVLHADCSSIRGLDGLPQDFSGFSVTRHNPRENYGQALLKFVALTLSLLSATLPVHRVTKNTGMSLCTFRLQSYFPGLLR